MYSPFPMSCQISAYSNTMQNDTYSSFQNIIFQNHFKMNSQKEFLVCFALRHPYQMVSRPFHSINPPGGTGAIFSAAVGAAAELALAIGLVMPSITLVSTMHMITHN